MLAMEPHGAAGGEQGRCDSRRLITRQGTGAEDNRLYFLGRCLLEGYHGRLADLSCSPCKL